MFFSLIAIAAVIALFVIVSRLQKRIALVERELTTLQGLVAAGTALPASKSTEAAQEAAPEQAKLASAAAAALPEDENVAKPGFAEDKPVAGLGTKGEAGSEGSTEPAKPEEPATPVEAAQAARKTDVETALGTRWAVWVGGIALALGGLFLIRYTIEAGIFGPGVRLIMAGILGLVLVAGAEFIRRTGFKVPVQGAAGAYIPAILTGAGAFILFGTVYAAHGIYGFIGPALAFALLGAIGIAAIAASLMHGLALAGIGLVGAMVTPALVSSQAPNPWALFVYLAIVLTATAAVARIRNWRALVATAFAGSGIWTILYMSDAPDANLASILFISLATLAVLALVWLAARDDTERGFDWPSIVPGFFIALSALGLSVDPAFAPAGDALHGAILLAALVGVAFYRPRAMPLVFTAGLATVMIYLGIIPPTTVGADALDVGLGAQPLAAPGTLTFRIGIVLALIFLTAGFWAARRFVVTARMRAACWAAWGVIVPLVVLMALWFTFGDIDRDLGYALPALLLVLAFAAGGEWIARAEEPRFAGGLAVSFALAGAGLAGLLMLHMAFGSGWTTVLLGAAAIVPALATRWRSYPVLGWIAVGAAVAVLGRIAFDPTIVGAAALSRTPVFNWLLLGYGVPALAFGFAAWQLARTTNGRPRLAMEAASALFALLTIAMLVRHAMHGGVIDTGTVTLAEQAIYTLIALGAGAILVAIDMRSPSSVLRYGSMAVGVVSAGLIAVQHFIVLNPLLTDESTGTIPVFNLLFIAYLLPAVAAGALAFYVRDKRPKWYAAMLALVAALLAFAYATLSVRRVFKGEFIALWSGLSQLETYTYSALWLVIGVALLTAGVWLKSQVLRIASAALIAVAVVKVFLFDMSELEGVLRALSFIGLGAVLIGIGLFYQRLLTKAAKEE
ncbi:DUF2339 domain-containing protein [Mesorhizobium sp. ORM8.1]